MRQKIVNGRLITPIRVADGCELTFEDGKITGIGPRDRSTDAATELIDADGLYVAPGFIDLHTHGGGGYDYMDGTEEAFRGAARAHASHGTTAIMPTSLTATDEETEQLFRIYRAVVREGTGGAGFVGLHLEGPYFSAEQAGAQDPRYLKNPEPEHYEWLLEQGKGIVARVSAAPELPGAMGLGRALRDRGILASMAHTAATDEEVMEALENGYTHITHLYSGMSTITRRDGYRFPGLIESAYMFPEVTSEVIADGCHIPPRLLKLAYREIGPDRLCLVTDSMRAAGMGEGPTVLGSLKNGQACIVEGGVAKMPDHKSFAGSVATADRLVRTMYKLAEVPLTDAVRMMTRTPARIAGLKSKGTLSVGMDADIVVFDGDIRVRRTMVGGKTVFSAE